MDQRLAGWMLAAAMLGGCRAPRPIGAGPGTGDGVEATPEDTGPGDTTPEDTAPPDTAADTGTADTGAGPAVVRWEDVLEVLAPRCGSCHMVDIGGEPAGFGGFGFFDAEDLLVPSIGAPHLPYVSPGAPRDSYLWHKVAGTHLAAGGLGGRMPPGSPLPDGDLERIRAWIAQGAQ